jgi:hypothetical protein
MQDTLTKERRFYRLAGAAAGTGETPPSWVTSFL